MFDFCKFEQIPLDGNFSSTFSPHLNNFRDPITLNISCCSLYLLAFILPFWKRITEFFFICARQTIISAQVCFMIFFFRIKSFHVSPNRTIFIFCLNYLHYWLRGRIGKGLDINNKSKSSRFSYRVSIFEVFRDTKLKNTYSQTHLN